MTKRWLLLGEAPNWATARSPHLWLLPDDSGIQHSANRLLAHSGYSRREYLETFERDNLLHSLPGRQHRGRAFPIKEARAQVGRVLARAEEVHGIVMLGKRVPQAFELFDDVGGRVGGRQVEYLTWYRVLPPHDREMPVVCVPHPSGLNRWWGSEENRRAAREFFEGLRRVPAWT